MAASVLRARVVAAGMHEKVMIDSAGTSGWHIGQGADKRAAATLTRHGYDDAHVARQLTAHDLADFDLVLVADNSNLADVQDLARTPTEVAKVHLFRTFDPDAPLHPEIPDPYYGPGDGFEEVLRMIEAAADGLVDEIRKQRANDE